MDKAYKYIRTRNDFTYILFLLKKKKEEKNKMQQYGLDRYKFLLRRKQWP